MQYPMVQAIHHEAFSAIQFSDPSVVLHSLNRRVNIQVIDYTIA
jgi:hypothetical protein